MRKWLILTVCYACLLLVMCPCDWNSAYPPTYLTCSVSLPPPPGADQGGGGSPPATRQQWTGAAKHGQPLALAARHWLGSREQRSSRRGIACQAWGAAAAQQRGAARA